MPETLVEAHYDVFISYTRRLHAPLARTLAVELTEHGYTVWFDEIQLRRKTSYVMQPHSELMEVLRSGIERSKCLLLFEMQAQAIPHFEGFDEERAIRAHQVERGPGSVLRAWTWQSFEFGCAKKTIVLKARPLDIHQLIAKLMSEGIYPSTHPRKERGQVAQQPPRSDDGLIPFAFNSHGTDAAENEELFLSETQRDIQIALRFPESGRYFAIIGGKGSGKTTLIRNALSALTKEYPTPYVARRNERGAFDECLASIQSLPRGQLIVFDDYGDGLEGSVDRDRIADELAFALREHQAVFVLTHDQAAEHLEGDVNTCSSILQGKLKLAQTFYVDPSDRAVSYLVLGRWLRYIESGVIPHRRGSAKASTRLVQLLKNLPIFSDLQPPDYTSLERPLLAEPSRSLAVLEHMARSGAVHIAVDEDYEPAIQRTLTALTGIHPYILKVSGRPRDLINSIAADSQITAEAAEGLIRAFVTSEVIPDQVPRFVAAVANSAQRHALAGTLATLLLGNSKAKICLDYSKMEEQVLPSCLWTDSFNWLLLSVSRYPWWILLFERLDLAPAGDRIAVNTMISEGCLSFGMEKVNFDRCFLVVDAQSVKVLPALDGNFRLALVC